MTRKATFFALLLVISVAGCTNKPISVPALTEADMAALKAAANFPHEGYRLEPGDVVQIRFTHHPEMTQDDVIAPDGKINVKLVGEVEAAGKTTDELEQLLVTLTSEHLKNPEVIVSVVRFTEKLVYVGGEVARPGTFPYRRGLTPLQAVAASGGFRDTARVDSVILVRTGGTTDKFVARKINLQLVVMDGVKEPLALAPHDILFVPRTDVADANIWVRQHISDMVPLFRGVGVGASPSEGRGRSNQPARGSGPNEGVIPMTRIPVLLALALAALVAACSSKPITLPPLAEADHAEMEAAANFPEKVYRLEPGDAIQIRYTHHPEMTQDDVIRPDGKINAKLVGQIEVAGLTKNELGKLLAKRTSDQLKSPEVVVSVTRFSEKLVYVAGEVTRPGTLPYRKGLTPLQAITASGGFRDTARYDSVILVRTGGPENKFIARKLDLEQTTNVGVKEAVVLAPHDVIFVPRTQVADANIWVRQHITDMIPLFRGLGISIPVSAF